MSQQTGSGHEGAVHHRFADGTSGGVWDDGPMVTTDVDGRQLPADRWITRTADEIVGWHALCTVRHPRLGRRRCWTGPVWTRVATRAEEDLDTRRLYWPGDAPFLDPATEDLILVDWQIHTGPADELYAVELASDEVDDAQHNLNEAVRTARDAGASWADVGRAVGISRQSAHERWAKMLAE